MERTCIAVTMFATLFWMGCEDNDDAENKTTWRFDRTNRPVNPSGSVDGSIMPTSSPLPPWANDTLSTNDTGLPSEIFERVYNEKKSDHNPVSYRDSCSYLKFKVGKELYTLTYPFARGSDTRLFLTRDNWYVLKVQDADGTASREMFWREHAAMQQARHTGVISVIEPKADLSSMSKECQSRSYVMRKVIGTDLSNFAWISKDRVIEIGRQGLKILEKFHDTGLIHGDIHIMNFMLRSVSDITNTLTLIDFGRSMSYIDPKTGLHRKQNELKPFTPLYILNWNLLSINELEGRAVSRADDIFRLAELLVALCNKSIKNFGRVSPSSVANQKRNRIFDGKVPQEIQAFYRYAIKIGFEERPNYSYLD